jgi:hypothetical protein
MKPIILVITVFLTMLTSVSFADPILTTPTVTNVGAGSATLVLHSSDNGTGYFTLLNGSAATCGSGAQVKAGQNGGGAAAPYFGSLLLTAGMDGYYTIRNLKSGTNYTICFTADSPTGSNLNSSPLSANLTTTAAISFNIPGWSVAGNAGFSAGTANSTSLAFAPDGTPYMAYGDGSNGGKATVKKYVVTSGWVDVGLAGLSAAKASSTSLAFSPDGTPYLAYGGDDYNVSKATVKKFNAVDGWTDVGSAGFSADTAAYTSLAFAPDGTPYVAYSDYFNGYKTTVKKLSGSDWIDVGTPGFSAGDAYFISLAFAPDGAPYVAFQDGGHDYKSTVMKFSGTAWVEVGAPGFSAGGADYTSLAIAPDGTPHIAYRDYAYSLKATVMKFNGFSWETLGNAGFSANSAAYTSFAVAPDGALYLAYQDGGNTGKATTMKFNGNSWSVMGGAGFTAGSANFISLAFAPDGTPYVAYEDNGNGSRATVMKLVNLTPTISGTPLNTATVGVAYNFVPTAAHADSFSISVNGVSNPTPPVPGLTFNTSTGALSGTPTTAGTYSNIVITAINAIGSASLPAFSIEVINFPDTQINSFPDSSSPAYSFTFSSNPERWRICSLYQSLLEQYRPLCYLPY